MEEIEDFNVDHVAIILDGNRRWAKKNGMPQMDGHKHGAQNLENLTKKAHLLGIKNLTVYIFSTENWNRSKQEVDYLMKLFHIYFKKLVKNISENEVRIRFFGADERLSKKLISLKEQAQELTKDNTKLTLNLCFNYGGRDEITNACKKISHLLKKGEISEEEITPELVSKNLYTSDLKDPDIIIRTSGEQRLSNFLLWQMAYSELFFVDKPWPDFSLDDLRNILIEYTKRDRRYGAG